MKQIICVILLTCPFMLRGIEVGYEDISRGFGLVPKIMEKMNVLHVGISTSDVKNGKITLSSVGSYSLLGNVVTDIEITGTNVLLDLAGRSVIGTISVSGDVVILKNGVVSAPSPLNLEKAQPAITVSEGSNCVLIKRCHVQCADSVLTGTLFELVATDTTQTTFELVATGTVFDSMPGRSGMEVGGTVVNVVDCSLIPGTSASTTTTHADDGGHGIILSGTANKVRLLECIMITGDGGNATDGDGGNGGHGIFVKDTVNHSEIAHCTIFGTGAGGNGSGNGGNGGHGIYIESTAVDIGVHDCRIRNTGIGGTPGGVGGKAVLDAVTTAGALSMVYSNFAHNIEHTLKFDLVGGGVEKGVSSPHPPDATVLNPFANVYVP